MWKSLAHRNRQPEIMDQPDLDPARHALALNGLARINLVSLSAGHVWSAMKPLVRKSRGDNLSVLDIASGGGDVTVGLWRRARRVGCSLRLTGYDVSDVAVDFARRRAEACGADVTFRQVDVFDQDDLGAFDIVTASLFLHHLEEGQLVNLLNRMARAARKLVVINDLRRCVSGYVAAQLVSRLLTRSDVVHVDGPLSIAAAFTVDELRNLAEKAGMNGARVVRRWPFRLLLTWSPQP